MTIRRGPTANLELVFPTIEEEIEAIATVLKKAAQNAVAEATEIYRTHGFAPKGTPAIFTSETIGVMTCQTIKGAHHMYSGLHMSLAQNPEKLEDFPKNMLAFKRASFNYGNKREILESAARKAVETVITEHPTLTT